jgi:hypothetical protein
MPPLQAPALLALTKSLEVGRGAYEAHQETKEADASRLAAAHDALEPQEVIAVNATAEQAKTRRTGMRLVAGGMAVGTCVAAGLYVTGGAERLANRVLDALKPSVPHVALALQVETALKTVTVPDVVTVGTGLVESDADLKLNIVSCPPLVKCITWTSGENTTTRITNVDGKLKGEGISLSSGHTGDGKKLSQYYPVVTVDPRVLSLGNSSPSAEDLVAAGYPANQELIHNGGQDGKLFSYAGAVGNLLGLQDENSYASRSDITIKRSADAATANCATVIDQTLLPGITREAEREINNAISLDASLPTSQHGANSANALRTIARQPLHIRFGYTPDQDSPTHAVKAVSIDAANVHFYTGSPIKNVSGSKKEFVLEMDANLNTTTPNKGCEISETALNQLEAITKQGGYVLDPVETLTTSARAVSKQGN